MEEERLLALESGATASIDEELGTIIDELGEDEQIDLVALVWMGPDRAEVSDWPLLRAQAADAHNERTAAYLMGIPLFSEFLEEGMSAFGLSCES